MGGTSDKLKGKAKEAWGKATDDKSTEAEGKYDQGKGEAKHVGDEVKNKLSGDDASRDRDRT